MSNCHLLDRSVASAFYGHFPRLKPAQDAVIEPILKKKNVVLSSGTGSGKTEAILAPLISLYWRKAIQSNYLCILYIAPTKALVNDLEKRLYLPLHKLSLRLGVRHGDRDDLSRSKYIHLLITTPESLDVLLFRKEKRLNSIDAVIIDEVHLLYNTQRGLHLSTLLKRLNQFTGKKFQWAALSATIGELSNVRDFLFEPEEEAVFFAYSTERFIDAHIRHVKNEDAFLKLMKRLIVSGRETKLLVFANSRRTCERLAGILTHDNSLKSSVFAHYSSLSPELRIETEKAFSSAKTSICIATSTLELGIDIGDIDAVVLWGASATAESFLQRIGRGNRRQSKVNAICLIPDNSVAPLYEALRFLALIDASQKGELPIRDPYELYGAAGQQCLSVIASDGGRYTRITNLCKIFEHKSHLHRASVEAILAELANQGYLQRHGFKNQYGADEKLYNLVDYRMIYGNFGANSQSINVFQQSKVLGAVPVINLLQIKPGMHVRFAGKTWMVRKASLEGFLLEPYRSHTRGGAVDFIYPGGGIGFDAFLCNRMWNIIHSGRLAKNIMDESLYYNVCNFVDRLKEVCQKNQIPYIQNRDGLRYMTFGGYLINKAIALFTNQLELNVDDISLQSVSRIDWSSIPSVPSDYERVFNNLFEMTDNQSLYQTLLPLEYQLQEFLQDWLKDQTISSVLTRLKSSTAVEVDSALFGSFI